MPPDAKVSAYALTETGGSYGSAGGQLTGQRVLRQGKALVNGQILQLDWGPLKSGLRSLVLNYSEDGTEISSSAGDFTVS
jgi:hypothetical protein